MERGYTRSRSRAEEEVASNISKQHDQVDSQNTTLTTGHRLPTPTSAIRYHDFSTTPTDIR